MISKLWAAEGRSFSAPENLAAEAFLTEAALPGEIILFLWRNEKTVVIGKNQNAWKECRLDALQKDGGTLVRRLSGGGAVFHDLGNLNVSFCLPREEEDIPRQTRVLLSALRHLGVQASVSGRNDLEADGRKFSGHAYYRQGTKSCHHATLMLEVDREALSRYLRVSPLKLRSRGVDSVRARVVNLRELAPALTIPALCEAIKQAFGAEYGLPVEPFSWEERLLGAEKDRLSSLEARFSSWDWTFGRRIAFTVSDQARFPWGEADLRLRVESGRIRACQCFTDAMDPLWTENMEEALRDVRFAPEDLRAVFSSLPPALETGMREDLERMIVNLSIK